MFKNAVTLILVNGLVLCTGIAILELLYGSWFDPANLRRLNVTVDKTYTYDVGNLYPSNDPEIQYRRDENGFRGNFTDAAEITILTVGGSTTDQRYLTEGATWQDVLQQAFAAEGKKVVVANAGVDGQSTYGHIKNFDWWFPYIKGLNPQFVLFYIGINELNKDPGHSNDALLTPSKDKTLEERINENSALIHIYRTLRGMYLADRKKLGHRHVDYDSLAWTSEPLQSNYDVLIQSRLQRYTKRLEILVERTNAIDATPIFVTNPVRYFRISDGVPEGVDQVGNYDGVPVNGVDNYHLYRRMYQHTLEFCNEQVIPCYDIAAEAIWEDGDFYDFIHMTPSGAQKVGTYLHRFLQNFL